MRVHASVWVPKRVCVCVCVCGVEYVCMYAMVRECAKGAAPNMLFVYFARIRQINLNLPALFARHLINAYQHSFVSDIKRASPAFCLTYLHLIVQFIILNLTEEHKFP